MDFFDYQEELNDVNEFMYFILFYLVGVWVKEKDFYLVNKIWVSLIMNRFYDKCYQEFIIVVCFYCI